MDYNVIMYALVGIVLIYIVSSVIGNNKTIEGLINRKDNKESTTNTWEEETENLRRENEKMSDSLLIDKYKNDYIDFITELEDRVNYNILNEILEKKLDLDPEKINRLYKLRDNLASSVDFLNSISGGGVASGASNAASKLGGFFK